MRYQDDLDQVPPMLYRCFTDKRYLAVFHHDPTQLQKWLEVQGFGPFFRQGVFKKEHILPLLDSMKPWEHRFLTRREELFEMLGRYCRLLEERGSWGGWL